MWQELALIHRSQGKSAGLLTENGSLWATCLRQVLFLRPGTTFPMAPEEQRFSGPAAHQFLVEICSGLHSPLFGETEVFGQFRAFREQQDWHPAWIALLDSVEEDVKKLRRQHLTSLGSQSYGSLVRRHLPAGEPVVLVGAGRLAKDLLPWLSTNLVTVLARDPEKAARELLEFGVREVRPLVPGAGAGLNLGLQGAHWLIAAPAENSLLNAFWEAQPAAIVLDFRGEDRFCPPPAGAARYASLHSLYAELEGVKRLHSRKRRAALAFAAELSRRREVQVLHRPFGWEDAFA